MSSGIGLDYPADIYNARGSPFLVSDEWQTPEFLLKRFEGWFDPCPSQASFDGLSIAWKTPAFVNPPYSQLRSWIEKSIAEHKKGVKVVLLIPSGDGPLDQLLKKAGALREPLPRLRFRGLWQSMQDAPYRSVLWWLK